MDGCRIGFLARILTCLSWSLVALCAIELTPGAGAHADTINNNVTGPCNIVINGSNNNIYGYFCSSDGRPKPTLLDPPGLWIGDDLATARKALGARRPLETKSGDYTILSAMGSLFGVTGRADYGFNLSAKLMFMDVQVQCSEEKYRTNPYTERPQEFNRDLEEWRRSDDARDFHMDEQETSCEDIRVAAETVTKLFGKASADRSDDHFLRRDLPDEDVMCRELYGGSRTDPKCDYDGGSRYTWDLEYIGTDRVTGIGIDIREVSYSGDIKYGTDLLTAQRREEFAVFTIWGSDGRPLIDGDPRGPFTEALKY